MKRLFDFYISSSLHVGLAVLALIRMTELMFGIPDQREIGVFAFCGTVAGYNFVKYDALSRRRTGLSPRLKAIILISFFCLLAAGWSFLMLRPASQLACFVFLLFTVLYGLPFFPNRKNARNWAGVKIYIVALCWMGVTVILPVINSDVSITGDFYLKCVQRFILVFVLILIFEIVDLAKDDPHLQTVPQLIGVARTKTFGFVLLGIFFLLNFFNSFTTTRDLIGYAFVVMTTAVFLYQANEKRHRYYAAFWVESIPVLWYALWVAI